MSSMDKLSIESLADGVGTMVGVSGSCTLPGVVFECEILVNDVVVSLFVGEASLVSSTAVFKVETGVVTLDSSRVMRRLCRLAKLKNLF